MKLSSTPARRAGLSLLEVLVALAIFLFALIVVSQLVILGGDRALDVQQQGEAAQLCQSKLAEVVVGAVPLSPTSDVSFADEATGLGGDWFWSLDCEQQSTTPGLWSVHVTVYRSRANGSRTEATLSQLVLDPSLRGSTHDPAPSSTSSPEDTSTAGSSSTTSSTSSTQQPAASTPTQAQPQQAQPTQPQQAQPASSSRQPASTPAPTQGNQNQGRQQVPSTPAQQPNTPRGRN